MVQNNLSILYAEDYDDIRSQYIKFLKLYFKNVYEAKNGQEALDLYKEHKPHIVILDIHMPIIDGLEVASQIREMNTETKIVMLSAYSEKEKLLKAIDISVTKYLIKPVSTFELEELLEKMIVTIDKKEDEKRFLMLEGEFKWNLDFDELLDKNNEKVKLTKNETLLLKMFCENPQKTYSNDDILNYIWDYDSFDTYSTNKLRTLLSKLKSKLSFNLFDSIYNVGYKLKLIY